MAAVRDPLRPLIDVAVYAPIGLALLARRELPKLIAAGKVRIDQRVMLARFVTRSAVRRGRAELHRRLDAAESARTPACSIFAADPSAESTAGSTAGSTAVRPVQLTTAASTTTAVAVTDGVLGDSGADSTTPIPAVVDEDGQGSTAISETLPIEGYDSLAASQVVVRLASLNAAELEAIGRHEASHRARRTILGKIAQLQAC